MSDMDWNARVADVVQRADSRGREEYLDMIDDVVDGMDEKAILEKHAIKPDTLTSALGLVTACLHGSRPAPALAEGGWYERNATSFSVAPEFAKAWKASRG